MEFLEQSFLSVKSSIKRFNFSRNCQQISAWANMSSDRLKNLGPETLTQKLKFSFIDIQKLSKCHVFSDKKERRRF